VPHQALQASKNSGQHSQIQILTAERKHSLHNLVVDSYIRNKTAVPSSFSTFLPKIHVLCPQVRVCVHLFVRSSSGLNNNFVLALRIGSVFLTLHGSTLLPPQHRL